MVSDIKNQYMPDYVSPPGETLLETIESRGMTQAELAERTGRPHKTISEIIKGKAAITPDTALQLEKVLGVPASFWTNRETQYRESLARQQEYERLQQQIEWLNTLPVSAMCQKGWIQRFAGKVQQLHEVLRFFAVASPEAWDGIWCGTQAEFRKSKAFESDPGAVAAWLRKGEIEAQSIECEPYSQSKFLSVLLQVKALTIEPPGIFQQKLVDECASAGVAVVFVPELPKTRVCGATCWLNPNKALIQLSLRYKTNDHLWFTFFHEAAHIYKHGKRDVFIESSYDGICTKETEADEFATNILIPRSEYDLFVTSGSLSENRITEFAEKIGIAPGIVVGRLQHEKRLPHNFHNNLKQRYMWTSE